MGLDPQVSLTEGDEGRDVLDPIRIEVLQLHLVMIEKPPEEAVARRGQPTLVKPHKGDDIPVWRCWHSLIPRYELLHHRRSCIEQSALDEALQPPVGHI